MSVKQKFITSLSTKTMEKEEILEDSKTSNISFFPHRKQGNETDFVLGIGGERNEKNTELFLFS